VTRIARRVPGLTFEPDHNAVGKDFTWLVYLGPTSTRSGVAFDTLVAGWQLSFWEGVELHLLQLTFGVSLFPPALKLPFLPRLGFPGPMYGS
jgi:hypothetical protein